MSSNPIQIKDKFDTESAERIVHIGYPKNADYITDMLFWCCFPNDPVFQVTYPYINSLSDSILSAHLPEFLEFHLLNKQERMIEDIFDLFINFRGKKFRELVLSLCETKDLQDLFTCEKYSFESYHNS
jgi:hypothetical protein